MKALPINVKMQGKTPLFSADTLPDALRQWHQTEKGVWAKIILSQGTALYEILTEPPETVQLSPGHDGIIEPQRPHRVTPSDEAEIQVVFYQSA